MKWTKLVPRSPRNSTARDWPRRFGWLTLATALCLPTQGCNRNKQTTAGNGAETPLVAGRMQMPTRTAVGTQPGYLADGLIYSAIRAHKVQTWLQHIPLEPRAARDLAEAGAVLGMDLRSDDVASQWGIDPDAVVSMTWFRPIGPGQLREAIAGEASSQKPGDPNPFAAAPPAIVEAAKAAEPMPGQIADDGRALPPPPPPPPPAVHPLAAKAEALAMHSRIHVPLKDLAAFKRQLAAIPREQLRDAGLELCASFNGELLCYADREVAILVREQGSAALIDFYIFPARTGDNSKATGRAEVVRQSRSAPPATLPVLATLSGDAVGYLHGPAVPRLHELVTVATAFRRLRWDNEANPGERFKDAIRDITALEQFRDVRKLFAGITFEGTMGERDVHLSARWLPVDEDTRKLSEEIFSRPDVPVGVPSLAGLCDGSLMCLRSSGLPNLERFGELATGIYGAKEREFSRALNQAEEMAALSMFIETWPNAIGAVQRWPAMELEGKPEGGIILGVIDAARRVEGVGGSLRSLHFGKQRSIHTDFMGYIRLPRNDANLVRTMLAFANMSFSPLALASINQKVETAAFPDSDVPASLFLVSGEAPTKVTKEGKTEEVEFGWLAVADSSDRLTWLLGLAMETEQSPAFYFEMPNLWNFIGSFPDAQRELNFARTWLGGQAVKFAVDVVDGAPRIDMAFEASVAPTTPTEPASPPPPPPPPPHKNPPPAT